MGPSLARLLDARRVLITGGSRGLGAALCRVFAAHGARVAFTFRRDEASAAAVADASGGRAFRADVTDAAAMASVVAELDDAWGGVDVLVNNAGITQNLPVALMDEEDWDAVLDVNVKGAFLATRAVLRGMIRRKAGVILNVGSLAGERAIDAPVHYGASKAALRGMTQSLAKEVARHGIRVLCLAPGLLDDGVGRNVPEKRLEAYLHHCALGRLGRCEEAAELAAFLVSDRNGYMNGETVVIDGGI